jgi:hypothetical protein
VPASGFYLEMTSRAAESSQARPTPIRASQHVLVDVEGLRHRGLDAEDGEPHLAHEELERVSKKTSRRELLEVRIASAGKRTKGGLRQSGWKRRLRFAL